MDELKFFLGDRQSKMSDKQEKALRDKIKWIINNRGDEAIMKIKIEVETLKDAIN